MAVHPRLVRVLLPHRSTWKSIAENDHFLLQQHSRQTTTAYRIITRGFPKYRVAEGDSEDILHEQFQVLSQRARATFPPGKITSKKITAWLKVNAAAANLSPEGGPSSLQDDEEDDEEQILHPLQDEDGYLSDLSTVSNEDMTEHYATTSAPMLRRAISFEGIKSSSTMRHTLLDDPLDRPASSASVSSPIPSDTRPSPLLPLHYHSLDHDLHHHHHHHHHHPYLDHSFLESPAPFALLNDRPHSAMSMRDRHFTLYRTEPPERLPQSPLSAQPGRDEHSGSSEDTAHHRPRTIDDNTSFRTVDTSFMTHDNPQSAAAARTSESNHGGSSSSSSSGNGNGNENGPLSWLADLPLVEAMVNWIEGPSVNVPLQKKTEKDKPNPILDIPLQFIALLTYPEPDPKMGSKMSLNMLRETDFVKTRRRMLLMLTAYTLLVRYSSFDFYLVILFASNCGMLFLMKNSGRVNVNMAKRAVGQRVGWAKQWAGGLFKRGGGNGNNNHSHAHSQGNGVNDPSSLPSPQQQQHQTTAYSSMSSSKSLPNISGIQSESNRSVSNLAAGDKVDSVQDTSPQTKRRGLFGKRRVTGNEPTVSVTAAPPSAASTLGSILAGGNGGGDDISVMTANTQKRRFFKRNTAISVPAPAPAPVPAPAPASTTSKSSAATSSSRSTAASIILTASSMVSSNGAESTLKTPTNSSAPSYSTTPTQSILRHDGQSSSPLIPQTQLLPQLQLLPPRSPSPTMSRHEFSSSQPWDSERSMAHTGSDSPPPSTPGSVTSSPKVSVVSTNSTTNTNTTTGTVTAAPQASRPFVSIQAKHFLPNLSTSSSKQSPPPQTPQQAPSNAWSFTGRNAFKGSIAPISPRPTMAIPPTSGILSATSMPGTPGLLLPPIGDGELALYGRRLFEDDTELFGRYSSSPEAMQVLPGRPTSRDHFQQQQQQQQHQDSQALPLYDRDVRVKESALGQRPPGAENRHHQHHHQHHTINNNSMSGGYEDEGLFIDPVTTAAASAMEGLSTGA